GGDDEEPAAQVGGGVDPPKPLDRQAEELRHRLRRHDGHARAAIEQAAHLLERHGPAADDEHAAASQVEAGHVVAIRHTPTECRRAPCRSSRTVISAEPAESESENAPGPTASSETERSF